MTRIRYRSKPVWHETHMIERGSGRPYCVAESPGGVFIRLKGTRQALYLPWSIVYDKAAWIEAARLKLVRAEKRRERRKARAG